MDNEKPLFSIVVPIYNEEQYIREALDSIAAQTNPDWEALLIDDGSTDSTPRILDEYAQKDERFRVFHKTNGGTSTAINMGIQEARGEWFCWLSGDDYFHPRKLEFHRRWMQNFPETLFFSTGYWVILTNGKKIEYSPDWLKLENPAYHLIQLLHSNWVMGISICVKREAWLKVGELDGRLRYAQDLDMWIRLMLNVPHRYIPERTCIMRYHPGQDSARFSLETVFDAATILIRLVNEHSFKELFPSVDLDDRNIARDILSRTIDIVASESDAYIFKLGMHALVHLRILEWIWDPAMDLTLREELRNMILKQAPGFISFYKGSPLGLLWQASRAAIKASQPHFKYFPCEADKIGKINYYLQRSEHSEVAQPLRTYLEQNEKLFFEEVPLNIENPGQLILLLPPDVSLDDPGDAEFQRLREIWLSLTRLGFFVLLIGKSKYTLGLMDGLPYLGAEDRDGQEQLLVALGDLDTVVALSEPARLERVKAERRVAFEISQPKGLASELLGSLIHKIQAAPRKKIFHVITARRLHLLRAIYTSLIPVSVRLRMRLGQRLRLTVSFLKGIMPSLKK
jgi:glycosyltransferase involved in cell wall biosynthesis